VTYKYSTDGGNIWSDIMPGGDLSTAFIPMIRFKAILTTTDTSKTPALTEMNLTYRYLGELAYITIVPSNPNDMNVSDTQTFEAFGYDSFGSLIGPVAVFWGLNGGMGVIPMGPSTSVVFAALYEGTGLVIANDGLGHTNSTSTFSVFNSPPSIIGQIEDQSASEDAGSWDLDLNSYASDDSPLSDLKWSLSGNDDSLYQVSGENVAGNHILTFKPLKDAWGDDQVTLWLEDPSGLKVGQNIWINITPVNDPPTFSIPPDLFVKANEDYAFDYSPYINDIDNDLSELILSVDDEHGTPIELVVTYRYPPTSVNGDRTILLTVSDGDSEANATITISVISPGIFGGWGWDSIM
jgi:hypothetical protein